MATKLTLTIDDGVIQEAKAYAKRRRTSVSKLVEAYLKELAVAEGSEPELMGVVAELAGVLRDVDVEQHQDDYLSYLSRKYDK